jgi:hypothetical protein
MIGPNGSTDDQQPERSGTPNPLSGDGPSSQPNESDGRSRRVLHLNTALRARLACSDVDHEHSRDGHPRQAASDRAVSGAHEGAT